jgi:tight adherence protein B
VNVRYVLATLLAIVLVALVEAGRQLYRFWDERRREELRRRLQALGDVSLETTGSLLRDQRLARSEVLDDLLRSFPPALWMEKLLSQTDYRITVAQVYAWSALAGCAGLLGMLTLLGPNPASFAAAVLLAAVPTGVLLRARSRRSGAVSEQLPEALDMLARSLRAGHALSGAFETVAKEMPDPIAVEFGRVFEAQRLGIGLEDALMQMCERVPRNGDVKMLTVAIAIQRETGGNLAEIFSNLAETIRARYRFFGKLRALTAEGRASALVVSILPFVFPLVLSMVNPTYMDPLVSDSRGSMVIAGAVTLWLVGALWTKRLTTLDY